MTQDSVLHPAQRHHEAVTHRDGGIPRWGGLAGIGGSLLFVVVCAVVVIFTGEPEGPAGPISRFPEVRVARTVENGLYLAMLVLWVPLALALHHILRRTRPAAALFGSALNVVGLVVLAAGAIPHVVTSRLADMYHADGATPAEQATLVALWQANQGMFEALLLVGLLVMPVGVILLGVAMRRDPAFGTVAGNVSVALGVVGLAAGTVMLVDPLSTAGALGVVALVGFHLVAGWKTYRFSTTAGGRSTTVPTVLRARSARREDGPGHATVPRYARRVEEPNVWSTARLADDDGDTADVEVNGFALSAAIPDDTSPEPDGATPFGLLAASLSVCTVMSVRTFLRRWGVPPGEVTVRVAVRSGAAAMLERNVTVAAVVGTDLREQLSVEIDNTPVTRLLRDALPIRTVLTTG